MYRNHALARLEVKLKATRNAIEAVVDSGLAEPLNMDEVRAEARAWRAEKIAAKACEPELRRLEIESCRSQ